MLAGFAVQTASAVNITINDGMSPSGIGKGGEDQETEPGMINDQTWDLEAFTINGNTLKVYSGFNLLGVNQTYGFGDIFIDVNGNAAYGGPESQGSTATGNGTYKYDYVIHFTGRSGSQAITTGAYEVISLAENDTVQFANAGVAANDESNPYSYVSGGTKLAGAAGSGTMGVSTIAASTVTLEDGTQITGGTHYVGELDLGFLGASLSGALFHVTLGCGNDNLIGRVPDAGSAVSLLGLALCGLSLAGWRFGKRS